MFRRHSWFWTGLFKTTDLCLLVLAQIAVQRGELRVDLSTVLTIAASWLLVSGIFHLYESRRLTDTRHEVQAILATMAVVYLIATKLVSKGWMYSRNLLLEIALATAMILVFHSAVRLVLRRMRMSGRNQRRVLIYGTGRAGREIATTLHTRPWTGMRIVGFIDDKATGSIEIDDVRVPVLGAGEDARRTITDRSIHEFIIALPGRAHVRLVEIVHDIADLNVSVRIVPDLFEVISVSATLDDVWGVPLIGVRQPMIHGLDALVKRSIDLVLASVCLVLSAPLLLIAGLLVKLTSDGPVLFVQERVGRNGELFRIMKFRTMIADAEARLATLVDIDNLSAPAFKIQNDPRLTPIGKALRATSIDELPQLINVLRGDMSLVGPRPEEARVVARYDFRQRQRLAVRPGITGPMQVGGRGDMPFERRLALEIDYIRNYSLLRDLELLVKTIPTVFSRKGAY